MDFMDRIDQVTLEGTTAAVVILPSLAALILPIANGPAWFFATIGVFFLVRFLQIFSRPEVPKVFRSNAANDRMGKVVDGCDMLNQVFRPPRLWGRNGHLQTAFYGILGHASLRRTYDARHCVKLDDGSTVIFDVFEPLVQHSTHQDFTLALCPGIANSSESNYIRTCVHYAQERGYRCAVLNHLGALKNIELSGNRIFGYGCTDELNAMMYRLADLLPDTRFVSIGFSMGANITTKWIGTLNDQALKHRIVAALSVCQMYDATRSVNLYHDWEGGRRVYNYVITENVKALLRRNYKRAIQPHVQSGVIDEHKLWASTSIYGVDEYYNRRVYGFQSLEAYYKSVSSVHCIPQIDVPIVFLNALDDPIVPPSLWTPVKDLIHQKRDSCFILTKHGGHLGFLEGHSLAPKSTTWLDRFVSAYADSAIRVYASDCPKNSKQ